MMQEGGPGIPSLALKAVPPCRRVWAPLLAPHHHICSARPLCGAPAVWVCPLCWTEALPRAQGLHLWRIPAFPSLGNLLHPKIKSGSPTLAGRFFIPSTSWEDQMQESGLTEIIPLIFTAVIWGLVPDIFKSRVSSGLSLGSGYSLMAARWQVLFSFLSVLRAHGITLEDCNHWRL